MSIADLAGSDSERQTHIVEVLVEAFADLIERDPRAFRGKFRKMAADPFAFYRGSAPLFYSDMAQLEDPWVDEATSRVWIQGDLHAENYGTYMDSAGVLVFDVNDFDEAYLGHYTWDLQRMAASLALLGFRKALSDGSISGLIETYAKAYTDTVRLFATSEVDRDFRLTLDNTSGPLLGVLQVARSETRVQLLDALTVFEDGDRRLASGPGARDLERRRARRRARGLRDVPGHDPGGQAPAVAVVRGQGRQGPRGGGDRLGRAARVHAARRGAHAGARERRDPVHEAGGHARRRRAWSPTRRSVPTSSTRGTGRRCRQQALQAHADPWVGWCELDGVGQIIKEVSPYEADLDWDVVTEVDEMQPLVHDLGRATAKVHCVSDSGSEHPLVDIDVEAKITDVIGGRHDEFAQHLTAFGAEYGALTREDHRRFVDAFRNGMIPGVEAD